LSLFDDDDDDDDDDDQVCTGFTIKKRFVHNFCTKTVYPLSVKHGMTHFAEHIQKGHGHCRN